MQAPLLDRIIDLLSKINLQESIDLRRELEVRSRLNPHAEDITQLRLLVLKNAFKNQSEAVKAMEHLGLVEEAMAFAAILRNEVTEVSNEVNKP